MDMSSAPRLVLSMALEGAPLGMPLPCQLARLTTRTPTSPPRTCPYFTRTPGGSSRHSGLRHCLASTLRYMLLMPVARRKKPSLTGGTRRLTYAFPYLDLEIRSCAMLTPTFVFMKQYLALLAQYLTRSLVPHRRCISYDSASAFISR